jgi:hypothetical protein
MTPMSNKRCISIEMTTVQRSVVEQDQGHLHVTGGI